VYPTTTVDIEEMIRLRHQGWSFGQLGQRYGLTRQRIHELYHRHVAGPGRGITPIITADTDPEGHAKGLRVKWREAIARAGKDVPEDWAARTLSDPHALHDDRVMALLLEGRTQKHVGEIVGLRFTRVSQIWLRWLRRQPDAQPDAELEEVPA
jgi:hypothetical protein